MDQIVTVAERKARSAARRRDAIAAVIDVLRAYASASGGRFLVFGSAAKGTVRGTSDLDVIVDFPPQEMEEAFLYLEASCSRRAVPCDPQFMPRPDSAFLQRILNHAVILE
jgi:predicted nucleotidyltransferase